MTYLEIVAAIFGFVCVYFCIVRNVWSWPTGLVQVVLLIAVFQDAKLYADMALHVGYVVLQIYGWWAWCRSRTEATALRNRDQTGHTETPSSTNIAPVIVVRSLRKTGNFVALSATAAMTALFSILLIRFTDASLPIVDSFIAAASVVAQYLLAMRYLQNWIFWIVVDIVGVGLFAYKELYPTAILYALFLAMATIGLLKWQLDYQMQLATGKPSP